MKLDLKILENNKLLTIFTKHWISMFKIAPDFGIALLLAVMIILVISCTSAALE
jgi:hypothetical protein